MASEGRFRGTIVRDLWVQLRDAVESIGARLYFLYWSWKGEIKYYVKFSSGTILIAAGIFPLAELVSHFAGEQWIAAGLAETTQKPFWLALFVVALVFLIWHNRGELKKPEYEYRFVRRLREILRESHTNSSNPQNTVSRVLEICYSAFAHVGISHVCIAWRNSDDTLCIRPDHVYPKDNWLPSYEKLQLKKKQGVAGWVLEDSGIRYVPRLYWPGGKPSIYCPTRKWGFRLPMLGFPHAVRFEFEDSVMPLAGQRSQLKAEMPHYGCVEASGGTDVASYQNGNVRKNDVPFLAFLSVPLKPIGRDLVGILNLDFVQADPLGKPEIEMALIFGLTIADYLSYNDGLFVKSESKTDIALGDNSGQQ